MAKPVVSIITPTYNRERYLITAVQSVLDQTFTEFELHIVDDGSTDNTRHVLKPFLMDKRLIYHYQENRGAALARNVGLKAARGNFMCFLDSDNMWEPNKLERQIDIFEQHPDVDVLYCNGWVIGEEGSVISLKDRQRFSGKIFEKLILDNFITNNSVMFRRECYKELGGFDESLRCAEDYDLWLRYSIRYNFYYLSERLYRYRIGSNRLSSVHENVLKANKEILTQHFNKNGSMFSDKLKKKAFSNLYTRWGSYYRHSSLYMMAMKSYVQAILFMPTNVFAWRGLAGAMIARKTVND